MSPPTKYIFPASVSTLDELFPEVLYPTFAGPTVPVAHTVSPYDVCAEYEAVDFYSRKTLNLGNTQSQGSLFALKKGRMAMSFISPGKKLKSHGARKSHVKRRGALPEPAQCEYEIVRYELRPKLPFTLQHRLWYPVEQAWYIYNYDKRYLPSFQIERLESLKRERDFALGMMRDGHMSYWKMVRDAEIGMFGYSPEFSASPRNGRATPLLGRGRSELLSYKSITVKSALSRALDAFNHKGGAVDEKSRAPINEASSIPYLYAQTLDAILEEDMFESTPTVTESPPRRRRPIRTWGLVVPKDIDPPATQSLAAAVRGSLRFGLLFANPTRRQSMDSGFAESRSLISSEVLMGTAGPIEIHSTFTRKGAHTRRNQCLQFQSQGCTMSSATSIGPLGPYYELAVKRVQSAVNQVARIRRDTLNSLKMVCRAHRKTITTVILPPYVDEQGIPGPR
ncbi:hypothetical protein HOY80DRAFT_1136257 [Tuber brumale]|nr:hypothetical protein HOY80DRAFT_1136257 [Tuber brumale]